MAVNGKVVTRGKDCVPRKGYICLESEGGVVHYRNVRIKELPPSDVDDAQVAIGNRGYRSIYSGLNLEGWTASDEGEWAAKDWVLSYVGSTDRSGKLESDQSIKQIGFVVDARLKNSESNAVVSAGPAMIIDLRAQPFASLLEPDGRWNRIEAWTDEVPIIEINGKRVQMDPLEHHSAASAGSLTLQPRGSVDFCNLYVRTLNEAGSPNGSR